MSRYFVGVDLGQVHDFTAISVIERVDNRSAGELCDGIGIQGVREVAKVQYHLRHLERFLGEPYTVVSDRVKDLARELNGPDVIVDATGCGRPVVDMLLERGVSSLQAITITGGDQVTRNGYEYRVPKRDLVGCLQVLLQNRQLKIPASISLRDELVTEMQNFRVKLSAETGHDSYEHWRSQDHDDLVLSVAIGCWYAHRDDGIEIIGWI